MTTDLGPRALTATPQSSGARLALAGCRLLEVIGRGGMGVVYRAEQLALGRPVAVKVLADELAADAGFRRRFEAEARAVAAIEHPNVIPVHAAGAENGRLYLVMRYVDGSDLRALLDRGPLEPGRAVEIAAGVAAGLDAAHARGIVHRDVKPANVLLDERAGLVFLSDFGIAQAAAAPRRARWFTGTADYVAPEVIRGEAADARADVYALACVLHECLTGRPPFRRASRQQTLRAHLAEPAPPLPHSLRALEEVLGAGMAKRAEERWGSAGELAHQAQLALAPEAPASPPTSTSDAPTRTMHRSPARTRVMPIMPRRRPSPVPDAPERDLGPKRRPRRPRHLGVVVLCALSAIGVLVGLDGPWGSLNPGGVGHEPPGVVAASAVAGTVGLLVLWLMAARLSLLPLLIAGSLALATLVLVHLHGAAPAELFAARAPTRSWGLVLAAGASVALLINVLRLARRAIGDAWRTRHA